MVVIFIRTLIIFASIIILMRLLGKRQLRELELSELVVSVMFADIAATPLQDTSIPLVNGLIPILTLFACELAISGGILTSVSFRSLICGTPSFLIINGEIQEKEMRKSRFSVDELFEELRGKEILDISTVQYAVLETDGTLSTILKPEERPASAGQLGLNTGESAYPIIIIEDGVLLEKNLKHIGKDEKWLQKQIKSKGGQREKDVFVMVYYGRDSVYTLMKDGCNA